MLKQSDKFKALLDSYVIFVTENDVLKGNQSIYNIERTYEVDDKQVLFNDGSHIIYVNGKYKGNDKIGKLIQDLWCKDPNQMNYEVLAKTTRFYKEEQEGVDHMCEAMQKIVKNAEEKAEERAKKEEQRHLAEMMLQEGRQPEEILHYFKILTLDDLKQIQQELLQDTDK